MSLECSYQVREVIRLSKIAFSALIECFIFRIVSHALHKSRRGKNCSRKKNVYEEYQGLTANLHISTTSTASQRMFCHQTWNLYNFMGQSHNNFLLHDLRSFHHLRVYEMQFSRRFCKFVYAINSLSPIPKRKLSKYKFEFAISFHLLRLMLQHDWCFHDVTFHNWTNFDASKL